MWWPVDLTHLQKVCSCALVVLLGPGTLHFLIFHMDDLGTTLTYREATLASQTLCARHSKHHHQFSDGKVVWHSNVKTCLPVDISIGGRTMTILIVTLCLYCS